MSFQASQTAFAAALTDDGAPMPPGLVTFRGQPDAARFAVYRNNVAVALIKALESRFPVVRKLVGDTFFRAMARDFTMTHKPPTPIVITYGDEFPDFVGSYDTAAAVFYLADVARLEAAWTRAYNAEDAAPTTLSEIALVRGDRLAETRLFTHPASQIVHSRFPIGTIWAAHQGDIVQPVTLWGPETVLIVRPAMHVTVHILPDSDASFARALFNGCSLYRAAEISSDNSRKFDFGRAVTGMISLGAFCGIDSHEVLDDYAD